MPKSFRVFDCSVIYLAEQIELADESYATEHRKEIPFQIAHTYQLTSQQPFKEDANGDYSEYFVIALSGSVEILLNDGVNKKTIQLNRNNIGVHLKAGIEQHIFNFSPGAICLVFASASLPLVSVATCSFNNSRFIIETLDSIKNQTYPNIEIVIVDDCSTDDSVALVSEWLKKYPGKYKFIQHTENKGGSAPYNVALQHASGKYYSTVDSDDALLPEKIETQVKLLESSPQSVAGVYSDAYVMDIDSNPLDGFFIQRHRTFTEIPSGRIYEVLLQGNYIPIMSLLIRRSVFEELGGYDESLIYGDFDMWLRITRKYDILYSDYVSSRYRIRPWSLSHVTTPKNWNYSDAKIFLKHIGAPLPTERLKNLARNVYLNSENDTQPLINELANKTNISFFKTAYLLWKFKIAPAQGDPVLMKAWGNDQSAPAIEIKDFSAPDEQIFLKDIVPVVPVELLRQVARDAYMGNNTEAASLVRELASTTNDRHIKMAWLLWQLCVPATDGEQIMGGISEHTSDLQLFIDIVAPVLANSMPTGTGAEKAAGAKNRTTNTDADVPNNKYLYAAYLVWQKGMLFVNGELTFFNEKTTEAPAKEADHGALYKQYVADHAPTLPIQLLKKMAVDAYGEQDGPMMAYCYTLAGKTNNRFLMTAHFLWKYGISPGAGMDVLAWTDERADARMPLRTENSVEAANRIFVNEIVPALPIGLLKKIAADGYSTNNSAVMGIVKILLKQTGNRYLKAAFLLWKYKIFVPNGNIILARVDGYCNAQVSNKYIDVCIYKDILGEIRSSNSSFFKRKKNMP